MSRATAARPVPRVRARTAEDDGADDGALRRLLATSLVLSALALGAAPLLVGCDAAAGGAGQDLVGAAQGTKKAV